MFLRAKIEAVRASQENLVQISLTISGAISFFVQIILTNFLVNQWLDGNGAGRIGDGLVNQIHGWLQAFLILAENLHNQVSGSHLFSVNLVENHASIGAHCIFCSVAANS